MYDLPYHKAKDETEIVDFILEHPFVFLTGCDQENNPVATQVPAFLEVREGKKYLSGHIMRNSDHHKAFEKNPNVLAVFTSKNCYVSGTWYSDPHIPSTWNYMSVHARGKIKFLEGEAIVEMLRKTSLHFEGNNPNSTTVYDNIPDRYKEMAMKAILAFEIEVEELKTVFKLSQDQDEESYLNIIMKLKERDSDSQFIADEMEKRTSDLFSIK